MKIKYNAPTVLTFAFICAAVLLLKETLMPSITREWFAVPGRQGFTPGSIRSWITLLTHVIGHDSWSHLVSNFSLILLIGPILEETYGSFPLFVMMCITALVTGALNVIFFSTGLLGASGVVFMMILLASFTNINHGEIPLTFILVLLLYLGKELFDSIGGGDAENISQFAHIVGGFIGSLFGFFRRPQNPRRTVDKSPKTS